MNKPSSAISKTYQVRGVGGQGACIAVQSVLQEHGLCGYTAWSSPDWHFLYLTHLEFDAVIDLLGGLNAHFRIQVENGSEQL
jgi:hypothetical protein